VEIQAKEAAMIETFARGRQVGPGELAQIRSANKPRSGTFVDLGSAAAIRDSLEAGLCPFCGESKYLNLAVHMNRSHGHSAVEIREMAGMLKGTPLCAPELSEHQRQRLAGKRLPDHAYTQPQKRRRYSAAGRAVQRKKSASQPDSSRRAALAVAAANRNAALEPTYRRIEELWRQGLNLKQIGAEVGMHYPAVKRALERAGLAVGDGRMLRWRR